MTKTYISILFEAMGTFDKKDIHHILTATVVKDMEFIYEALDAQEKAINALIASNNEMVKYFEALKQIQD